MLQPDGALKALYRTNLPNGSSIGTVAGFVSSTHLFVLAAWVGEGQGVQMFTLEKDGVNVTEIQSQSIEGLGNAFTLSADMQIIEGVLVLVLGTSKRMIDIFHLRTFDQKFIKSLSLPAHSDWIHALSFNDSTSGPILLASASQDTYVKLWRFEKESNTVDCNEISVTKNSFAVENEDISFNLEVRIEAVLAGHEDWVHSVAWDALGTRLVTSSSDKAIIIWTESEEGVWTDSVRLGIVGGQAAGFYSADFSTDGKRIVATSYYGGLYGWIVSEEDEYLWESLSMPSGHSSEVRDLAWEPRNGSYLISVGKDQTTRVYAPVKHQNTWAEIARPQVHGHDMQCVVGVDAGRFVSGAEEKIFRAFGAPQTFATSLATISGCDGEKVFSGCSLSEFGARVPALGLSNKAVDRDEQPAALEDQHWEDAAFQAAPASLKEPPTEDCLMQNTLWPELHKLYGHGFEVYSLAANPDGTVIATSCKASHADHAQILFWSTEDWSRKGQVSGHQLTVTQLEWSPDGHQLVSVSRDRSVVVYKEEEGNKHGFKWIPVWKSGKEHSRIIWSCAWASDSQHFITASRDQKVILWKWDTNSNTASSFALCKATQPVTAVAIGKAKNISSSLIATGLQDGSLQLLRVDGNELKVERNINDDRIKGVDAAVLRLRFQPTSDDNPLHQLLAVAGTDCKMRIYKVTKD